MADAPAIVLDDRLLIEELLVGLPVGPGHRVHTTAYWYYRACRAAVAGAGGHLSGPFAGLDPSQEHRSILALLELREEIGLPDPRATVPLMAKLSVAHPRLNLLNLEAVAAALILTASVWLSVEGAAGVLPAVLDAERISWTTVVVE